MRLLALFWLTLCPMSRLVAQEAASPDQSRPADAAKPAPAPAKPPEHRSIEGTIAFVAKDGLSLRLRVSDEKRNQTVLLIHVTDQSLKDKLKGGQNAQTGGATCTSAVCSCICPGDKIVAKVTVDANNDLSLEDLDPQWIQVSSWEPWIVMLVTASLFLAVTFAASRNIRGLLFLGEDNRYSNSKTQLSLWFGLVIVTYVSAFFMRWFHAGLIGHIGIPMNLLVLSGLSALTFAGAHGITSQKNANAQQQGQPAKTDGTPSFPGDLIRSDVPGQFDLGDFQMIVITLIAVVSYIWIAVNFLGELPQCLSTALPDVDGTVVALFGVGQGAYLTKKATTDVNH